MRDCTSKLARFAAALGDKRDALARGMTVYFLSSVKPERKEASEANFIGHLLPFAVVGIATISGSMISLSDACLLTVHGAGYTFLVDQADWPGLEVR
jgi:hypothetical protein